MAPCDSQSSTQPKPVVEIKLEIKRPDGQVQNDTLRLYSNDRMRIGRDKDHNDFVIDAPFVSRKQLEFYTVVFDEEHYPMVYVRDRESTSGTYVNDRLIGGREDGDSKNKVTPGRILRHSDIVSIGPDVTFEIVHPFIPRLKLNTVQAQEVLSFHDKYAVTNFTIGSGASAQVHLAIDQETSDYVVCKVYDLESLRLRGRESVIQRLVQETHVRSQIEHPNLASFRGAYKSHSNLYVFEDLATGGDLFTLTERGRSTLSEVEVRWLIRQVMTGAGYMHTKGLVHRDLKLENVLCAISPQASHRIVITDFGHTCLVGDRSTTSNVGTPGWQAPEIISPNCHAGPPADIWSIGVLAIYLLCGSTKCESVDLLEAFAENYALFPQRNINEPTNELGKVFDEVAMIRSNVTISKAGKGFIRRCFQARPERRLTAAAALKHPWLCGSDEETEAFKKLEKDTTHWWEPRTVTPKACEDLNETVANKPEDGALDQLVSPFFPCKLVV
ncbi:meiosis-specific serine threonine-protein kinase mek1 [Diaporthe amygdali]|uniref:meiosis-specific serine threonine-protein kinase mek1 n=1 Tax=Phomopsis amygdali TaxID=1214568 RepID=UPI0022FF330B|nr:meiosis-specific serine threonine-protein kinase mek1 [Diaporthe amygdali]KAJ0116413.1 meiosis-specific serine threonine-protein kinase mek1 [Diaporthe amygdali]